MFRSSDFKDSKEKRVFSKQFKNLSASDRNISHSRRLLKKRKEKKSSLAWEKKTTNKRIGISKRKVPIKGIIKKLKIFGSRSNSRGSLKIKNDSYLFQKKLKLTKRFVKKTSNVGDFLKTNSHLFQRRLLLKIKICFDYK